MKVTVRDCLHLAAFDRAQVLAGKDHLDRVVKKVSVLEAAAAADVAAYCTGREQMVLTSFFGMRADEDAQCRAIQILAGSGTAALVLFHVGEVVRQVSRKVVLTAEKAGLPLIALAPDLKMDTGDVIAEISGQLLMRDKALANTLLNNAVVHLLNFEKYTSFPEAARAAALANDFQLILLSEDFNPIFTIETRHRTTIAEAIRLGRERDVERSGAVYTLIDVNGVLTYWGPITIRGRRHFMFLVDNEDSYSASEITRLAEIIELAMGMWHYTPERDSRAELIQALRRGSRSLAYSLVEEAGIEPGDIVSVFSGTGLAAGRGRAVMEALEADPQLTLLRVTEEAETYALVLSAQKPAAAQRTCCRVFDRLRDDRDARLFHVTGLSGLEEAADAYRLINEAAPFAQAVFPHRSVFTKFEMTLISSCIHIHLQGGIVKKNYTALLRPLDEDSARGRQLLETLLTFVLDAGMNSGRTAELLDIHANTVQYRLHRINDLLGVEVNGSRVIPGLTLALALRRLERVTV
ncbi:MAG: PucR family transcriptional regulator [Anaerovoracaceae bacterium]|jgi:hypothetical protein